MGVSKIIRGALVAFVLVTASFAQTFTTNLSLTKPASGAANWHTPLNANFDAIDALFNAAGGSPVPAVNASIYRGGVNFAVLVCGSENAATVDTTCSFNGALFNRYGQGLTILEAFCQVDAGTPRVQVYRLTSNTSTTHDATTRIFTDNTNAGLDCSNAGTTATLDGTTKAVANGSHIDFVLVSASTAKRVTLQIKYSLD